MNIQEINQEFAKAGPQIIHLADGSQKKAVIIYLSKVAEANSVVGMAGALEFVYSQFEEWSAKQSKPVTLALYLNTKMSGN